MQFGGKNKFGISRWNMKFLKTADMCLIIEKFDAFQSLTYLAGVTELSQEGSVK